ncbi:MAG: trehalase / alfa-L-rhamnosidase / mannosyl oligosaccharide glucosidase [Oscillospiraceae bacterium]|nr:trehalase / alfa-L-rhamnosidase / mannosyl oligosaccharide glucosidase [Oscillospiraceae bacterium]
MMNERDYAHLEAIQKYIQERCPRVFKSASARFPHPFIDPGSIYDSNLWDWDTFWTAYALMGFSRTTYSDANFSEKLAAHARGNVLNFLEFQLPDGYIPMMVGGLAESDGLDSYLIRKHKEGVVLNIHKPFLCQQACIVSGYTGSFSWLEEHIPKLEKYFDCYDRFYYNENCGLYVWADDVMIGMDNDPAVFGRPRFSTASVFLNGFMVGELRAMAKILTAFGKKDEAISYRNKADRLNQAIQTECWDSRDRFFYSVDVDIKTRNYDWFHKGLGVFWKTLPVKVRTWTGFIPLFTGIATKEQAADIVRHTLDAVTFCSDFGVRALARDEKMYNLEATNNPSNWLGPIWLVVNYVVFRGLLNYGYRAEAETLCQKTLRLLGEDLEKSGELHEYYNPETGEPVMSPGFLNWNMLAVNMVQELESGAGIYDYLTGEE